jgi:hypothetical protein
MNSFEFPTTVHANRDYDNDKVRHYKQYPEIRTSLSGQFDSGNFPELLKLISNVSGEVKKIYFVDTRHDTHFELNGKPVSYKFDNNLHMPSDKIIEKEKMAALFLKNQTVIFTQKPKHGKSKEVFVENSGVVQNFILSPNTDVKRFYFRLALDPNGPLTDVQVDTFLSLLSEAKDENAWLHINSIIGGGPAVLLAMMEDILLNGANVSLEAIAEKYDMKFISAAHNTDFLKQPIEDEKKDPNVDKKAARALFLVEFYNFAATRLPQQSWSDWKAKK